MFQHAKACTHLRAHLHHYMLTLHTYLLHISFHKEFLIKMGSCFLWNLVLHHTLLKLLEKRKYSCYSSNSSNHCWHPCIRQQRSCASLALMTSGSRVLHYSAFTYCIYLYQPPDIPIYTACVLSKHKMTWWTKEQWHTRKVYSFLRLLSESYVAIYKLTVDMLNTYCQLTDCNGHNEQQSILHCARQSILNNTLQLMQRISNSLPVPVPLRHWTAVVKPLVLGNRWYFSLGSPLDSATSILIRCLVSVKRVPSQYRRN